MFIHVLLRAVIHQIERKMSDRCESIRDNVSTQVGYGLELNAKAIAYSHVAQGFRENCRPMSKESSKVSSNDVSTDSLACGFQATIAM